MSFNRPVTITHVQVPNSDQANFPVLFSGTYTWLKSIANGGEVANANGYDIYFSSDDAGLAPLIFERVIYQPTTGKVEFWVKVPLVSHTTDTVFYVNYGDSSITTDQSNKTAVWDSHYKAVFHFGDGVTLDLSDSTINGVAPTNHGGTPIVTTGWGGGINFLHTASQYLDLGSPFNQSAFSIESWAFDHGAGDNYALFNKVRIYSNRTPTGTGGFELFSLDSGNGNGVIAATNAGATVTQTSNSNLYASNPAGAYIAFTSNGSLINSYGGDAFIPYLHPGTAVAAAVGTSSNNLLLGTQPSGPASSFADAWVEEFRISDVVRSADYFATMYNATANYQHTTDGAPFFTIGPEKVVTRQQPVVYVIT